MNAKVDCPANFRKKIVKVRQELEEYLLFWVSDNKSGTQRKGKADSFNWMEGVLINAEVVDDLQKNAGVSDALVSMRFPEAHALCVWVSKAPQDLSDMRV